MSSINEKEIEIEEVHRVKMMMEMENEELKRIKEAAQSQL